MLIRQYRELGATRGIKKKASAIKTLGRSYDDTFSKTDPTITGGLDKFFQKNGVSYFEGSRKKIIEQIEKAVQHHQQSRVSNMDTAPAVHSQPILKYNIQRTRTGIIKTSLKSRN